MDHQDLQPCGEPDRPPQVWVHEQTPPGADGIRARVERVVELGEYKHRNRHRACPGEPSPALDESPWEPGIQREQGHGGHGCADEDDAGPHRAVDDRAERCLGGRRMSRESSGSTPSASAGTASVSRLIHRICVARSGTSSPSCPDLSPMTPARSTPKNIVRTSPAFEDSRYRMHLRMLAKIDRPSSTAATI